VRGATPNRLLARLAPASRKRFERACTPMELALGAVLTRAGAPLGDVYFPMGAYISQVMTVDRREVEVGLVGDEGMYGIPAGMGVDASPVTAVVQGAGAALRMPVERFDAHLARDAALRDLVARYSFVVYSHAVQGAACHRFHRMEQRLARWLLLTADRARSPTFRTTHQVLAAMLGVRRAGVTETAAQLRGRDLLRYRRGVVTIVDLPGMEAIACPCYQADRALYRRILGKESRRQGG
jgi:CRP-like cAMP-binding protein